MGQVLPKKADWIQDKVVSFDPDNNTITTEKGTEISYEFLVVAMGLTLRYDQVSVVWCTVFVFGPTVPES